MDKNGSEYVWIYIKRRFLIIKAATFLIGFLIGVRRLNHLNAFKMELDIFMNGII